jgi:hypothetical protein
MNAASYIKYPRPSRLSLPAQELLVKLIPENKYEI